MSEEITIDVREALRYLGVGKPTEPLLRDTAEVARELMERVTPTFTYKVYDLQREGDDFLLSGSPVRLTGASTERMLRECQKAVLMACTIGAGFESMLRREQARNMARAVTLDSCGSAYVESACDYVEEEIRRRMPGYYLTDRFSPGYGDLPLAAQREIFTALEITKRLGVHLSETLLMNPSKSVTAIIGLSDRPQAARIRGCAYCSMKETCWIRKQGSFCGN